MSLIKAATSLHNSVSALMDDPLKEDRSTASYYLTMHCLLLTGIAILLIKKHMGFDLFDAFKSAWPIKSTNFRNPLSGISVLTLLVAAPYFLFWSRVGKSSPSRRFKLRHYPLVTFGSAIGINIPLLFLATELHLPELSMLLGLVNFLAWANWSVAKYTALTKLRDHQLPAA